MTNQQLYYWGGLCARAVSLFGMLLLFTGCMGVQPLKTLGPATVQEISTTTTVETDSSTTTVVEYFSTKNAAAAELELRLDHEQTERVKESRPRGCSWWSGCYRGYGYGGLYRNYGYTRGYYPSGVNTEFTVGVYSGSSAPTFRSGESGKNYNYSSSSPVRRRRPSG